MGFEYENKLRQRIDELIQKNSTLAEAAMESFRETASVKDERDRLAAENAELKAKLDPDALTICYMSGQATGDAEARAMAKRLRAA